MKRIGRKLWLPVVTALIIAMGVLVLTGAISCTQSLQTGETVMQPAETPAGPSHSEGQPDSQTAAVLEKRDIPALPQEFTVTGVGTKPKADQLSFEQAAAVAVDLWKKVFGDRFQPAGAQLYVINTDSGINRSYDVYSGSQFADGAAYICTVDSVSGQPVRVQKQTPYKQENLEDDPDFANDDLMQAAKDDPKYKEITEAFINEKFADGRSIVKVHFNGVGWDFTDPDVDMIADSTVEMSEGECYQVFIAYPSYEVVEVDFFPLGWSSVYKGYFYQQDGESHPSYEGTWSSFESINP